MKPSKVAVIYARDENGKVLAKARVSNLSHEHVESVKRSLLETVGTMVLRRKCEPKEVDIDDSAVVEKRKKEAAAGQKAADELEDPEGTDAYELRRRGVEHEYANEDRSDLTRQFELRRRSRPAPAPTAVVPAEAPAAAAPSKAGLLSRVRRLFRGVKPPSGSRTISHNREAA